jgi:hypothetical protein
MQVCVSVLTRKGVAGIGPESGPDGVRIAKSRKTTVLMVYLWAVRMSIEQCAEASRETNDSVWDSLTGM